MKNTPKPIPETKLTHILEPLKAAQFESDWRVCDTCGGAGGFMVSAGESDVCSDCTGTGAMPQHEPDDGGEYGGGL